MTENAQALPGMLQKACAVAFTPARLPATRRGYQGLGTPDGRSARSWTQAAVAQLVEQGTFNPKVVGSSPTGGMVGPARGAGFDIAFSAEVR